LFAMQRYVCSADYPSIPAYKGKKNFSPFFQIGTHLV
jgi:hypothetical protein